MIQFIYYGYKEINKEKFNIFDPVGIYDALKEVINMKPVVQQPKIKITELIDAIKETTEPKIIAFQIQQVIAKLQRKKNNLSEKAISDFKTITGQTIDSYITNIETLAHVEAATQIIKD